MERRKLIHRLREFKVFSGPSRFSGTFKGGPVHKRILKSSREYVQIKDQRRRFEHWYVDEQVYFITARCRDKYPAFNDPKARTVFWNRFDQDPAPTQLPFKQK